VRELAVQNWICIFFFPLFYRKKFLEFFSEPLNAVLYFGFYIKSLAFFALASGGNSL